MEHEITETRVGKNRFRGYRLRRIDWGTSVTYRGTSREGIDFCEHDLDREYNIVVVRDFNTLEELKRKIKDRG